MMTNDELERAVKIAAECLDDCAPMYRERYEMLRKHLDALLAEQLRRAKERPDLSAPPPPTQPVLVPMMIPAPTWVPRPPWEPPYTVTCGAAQ